MYNDTNQTLVITVVKEKMRMKMIVKIFFHEPQSDIKTHENAIKISKVIFPKF